MKKEKTKVNLACKLREQADIKNKFDCKSILDLLNDASNDGEYCKTVQLKSNQAHYIKTLGLTVVDSSRVGYYEISWKDEE